MCIFSEMEEKHQILYCLKKMEENLHWKPHAEWKDYEFKLLKKKIQEASGINISTHTLKRLFGKLHYRSDYRPQHATKDALARYLNYNSWEAFIQANLEEIKEYSDAEEEQTEKHSGWSKKTGYDRFRRFLVPVLIILATGPIAWFVVNRYLSGPGPFEFGAMSRNGEVPLTVTFQFDISKMRSGQVMIDFDYVHPSLGSEYFLTDRSRTFLNHTYQIPGVYRPKLYWKNTPVDSVVVVVRSEGWVSFYHPESGPNQYWMDNMYLIDKSDGLIFSRSKLASYGLDSSRVYYTTHRNIDDFGVSGDNFNLKAEFINGPETGGISCYDSKFTIFGEHSSSLVEFVESNCHRYSRVKFGEIYYLGDFYDLSALTFTPGKYHEMSMEVKEKRATVFLDGSPVYSLNYQINTGEIKGLEVFFKGSGRVYFLTLTTANGDTAYHMKFGGPKLPR